jgi:HrpA-like RNA helicase
LKAIGINNILLFEFLDTPSEEQILQALTQLYTLRAIDSNGYITALGRKMSNFPLDPSLSRILIESASTELDCLNEMVNLCSMLCVENVFYRPKLRKGQLGATFNKNAAVVSASNNNKLKFNVKGVPSLTNNGNNNKDYYGPASQQPQQQPGDEKEKVMRLLTIEEEKIELAHSGLRSEYGDLVTLWKIFKLWEKFNFSYEWCERNYINYRSMKTARKIR